MRELELVLLHGFLGGASSWDGLLARLDVPHSVTRLEILGHGTPSGEEALVQSFDEEVGRLLRHIRPPMEGSRRCLIGYSLGARVALGLAARSPAPFDRLILVSGRDGLVDPDEAMARAALDDALARVLTLEGVEAFVDRWEALPLFATQTTLESSVRAAHRERRLAHSAEGLAQALRVLSLGRMPRLAAAAFARTPDVTLVVGEHDEKFRLLAEALVRAHGAEMLVVPGAGHDVLLERPEALAALLAEPA